jgi:hypothetical protein
MIPNFESALVLDSFCKLDDECKFSLIDFIDECNKNDNLSIFFYFDA